MIESGTVLQNRYLIEKAIGEGGMGVVYQAVDQRFNSRVAIKETFYKQNDLGEAFEREARLLNSLHHPILPHVSDYFTEGNGHFLVMEFIEGDDLSDILNQKGAFAIEDVLRWADELLEAIDYLHSQEPPIIHRDIKPGNLKLTMRGNIILLDFGLAKLNPADQLGVKSVFGYSRTYSPLEQIEGTGTDARSDIFSLGATVYHLLTGQRPSDSLSRASAIVAGRPDPLKLANEINPQVPLTVAQVLHTALALNPAQRFVSAKVMRQALKLAVNAASESEKSAEEQTFAAAAVAAAAPSPKQQQSIPNRSHRFQEFLNASILSSAEAGKQPIADTKNLRAPAEIKDFPAPVETKNFPALAAFAAETAKAPVSTKIDEPGAIQVQIPRIESPAENRKTPPLSVDSGKTLSLDAFEAKAADSPLPTKVDPPPPALAVRLDEIRPANQPETPLVEAFPIKFSPAKSIFQLQEAPTPQAPAASEVAARVRRSNKPSLVFAALATILIGVGLSAWLISSPRNAPAESEQAPLTQSTPTSNAKIPASSAKATKSAPIRISPNPETLSAGSEKKTETRTIPNFNEKAVDARKTPVTTAEQNKKSPASIVSQNQTAKSAPAAPAAQKVAVPQREAGQRVHNSAPVSSIEKVMTGDLPDTYEQRRREEQRVFRTRRQRQQMSAEELEELRRRRTEDILRQNRRRN